MFVAFSQICRVASLLPLILLATKYSEQYGLTHTQGYIVFAIEAVCFAVFAISFILSGRGLIKKDTESFFKYAVKLLAAGDGCSESCLEMGLWYEEKGDYNEALIWFYNAIHETEPIIKLSASNIEPLTHMADIYDRTGEKEQAAGCRRMIDELGK